MVIWLIKALAAGALALILLSVVVTGYEFTGTHIDNPEGYTDYKWNPYQYKGTMTEGFSWLSMDQNGFNNGYPAADAVDILLMGSSHMEAVNIPPDKNVGYLLNERLEKEAGLYTYNIGVSGHTLYHCAKNMEAAVDTYHPSVVAVETSTVELDTTAMEKVLAGSYPKLKSYDSGLLYQIQRIPSIKWLYKQAGDLSFPAAASAAPPAPSWDKDRVAYAAALDGLLAQMKAAADRSGADLILFYHPTLRLNADGSASVDTPAEALALFASLCEENGVVFLDMTADFLENYRLAHTLPHGFSNTPVGTGHLNETGHALVADRLCGAIAALKGQVSS